MPMPTELRDKLLVSTREQAVSLFHDLKHLEAQIQKKLTGDDVRRMSVILRRILVERAVATVASPRIQRIALLGPDNNRFIDLTKNIATKIRPGERWPIVYYGSGGHFINGKYVRSILLWLNRPSWVEPPSMIDPPAKEFRLDNFLSQPVIYFRRTWIKRVTVIKYVANHGHGVHSLEPKTPEDRILSQVRKTVSYPGLVHEGKAGMHLNLKALQGEEPPFEYEPDNLDPLIVELLASAHYLVRSPDVIRLMAIIEQEAGIKPSGWSFSGTSI